RIQRGAVRAAWPALSPPARSARRTGAADARRFERADHVSRGQGTRAPRHAARRLSSRHRQRIRPARRARRARDAAHAFPRPRGVIYRRRAGNGAFAVAHALSHAFVCSVRYPISARGQRRSMLRPYRTLRMPTLPPVATTTAKTGEGAIMKIVGFEANG